MRKAGIVRECEHPGKPHKHGMACYHRDGCRCEVGRAALRAANARSQKARILGLSYYVDAAGTRRRLQALVTLGHTGRELMRRIGRDEKDFAHLVNEVRVTRRVHDIVVALYNDLWNKPATGRQVCRTQTMAKKRGYAPPMAWDDDSIDDPLAEPHQGTPVDIDWLQVARAVAGKPRGRRLTKQERRAAAEVMALKGASASAISKTLGLSGSDAQTVIREVAA